MYVEPDAIVCVGRGGFKPRTGCQRHCSKNVPGTCGENLKLPNALWEGCVHVLNHIDSQIHKRPYACPPARACHKYQVIHPNFLIGLSSNIGRHNYCTHHTQTHRTHNKANPQTNYSNNPAGSQEPQTLPNHFPPYIPREKVQIVNIFNILG